MTWRSGATGRSPAAAIIDYLSTEPALDPGRIGVWGVSLGGYYAPRVASGDARVQACVALAGPYDFAENWDEPPSPDQGGVPGPVQVAGPGDRARAGRPPAQHGRAGPG